MDDPLHIVSGHDGGGGREQLLGVVLLLPLLSLPFSGICLQTRHPFQNDIMNSDVAALGWIGSWELSFLFYDLATWRVSVEGGIRGQI